MVMSWKGAKGEKLMLNDLFTDFQWRVVLMGKNYGFATRWNLG